MDSEKIKCVIEIGSKKISCIIAEANDDFNIKILSNSTAESKGIHNGVIVSISEATKAIRSCLSLAETRANIVLKKVNVVLEIPEFTCTRLSKYRKVDGTKIHKDDIDFLLKESKKEVSLNDTKKSIIHIFNHNYIVDGKEFINEPVDIYAEYLSHEMTFITIPKNIIKNFNQIFVDCDLEIERFISKTFSLAVNYLKDTDFKFGATLIDIGFEKTSLGIFKNFALIHSLTFPIGINHITKDISKGCSLSLKESENIKNQMGCFYWENDNINDDKNNISKNFFIESNFRKITKSLVSEIITARMEEIFDIVKKEIYFAGLNLTSGQNIFITGGGSHILYLKEFCSGLFDTDIKILENEKNNFDSCNGAIKIIYNGWVTEALPALVDKKYKKRGFFSRILGKRA